ncbi:MULTISPECIES: hypothetical protein [Brevundimonas]|uniref:hypothetical protein n=1 Tax=Brevundimonas TaxID=41275 RepID=UPI0019042D41|nr:MULTISPECIES: hypothetical protein [Brevundimonas]MDA0742454.1 hypothetical protein [Pseudomonadota bacterium]MBK1969585.1 hypothetical protein [Brevundimonas diminuta]MBK1974909.1 hypothetical protein [Brevundimonas diminuta]MDA1321182.1 hypothetical protein [Pseudomonadota bacterium]MDM8352703.1 hypothetical protein [Brevundimonas diminuta]
MKAAFAVAALSLIVAPAALFATSAAAQQDPAERARIEELTRRLNGAMPAPQTPPPTTPQTARTPAQAAPQAGPQTARRATPPAAAQAAPQPRSQPTPAPRPQPPKIAGQAPLGTPRPQAVLPAPPSAPNPQGLSGAQQAALPFSVDLPPGFLLIEGRAAPGAHVYSARKAGKTYLMIYTGPSSQFPIYDGEQVTTGGRISVVVPEGARRIAMEHLFQRSAEPAEIHVWVMAQDGADRDEAERIAQTVDPK